MSVLGIDVLHESWDATHICPECGSTYICAGCCGYHKCSRPERVLIELNERYPESPYAAPEPGGDE